jgi:hypothetical protein
VKDPMRQCLMTKSGVVQTAWIPEDFAVVGKILDFRSGMTWERGWKVEIVHEPRLEQGYVRERSQDYKHTRQASDA